MTNHWREMVHADTLIINVYVRWVFFCFSREQVWGRWGVCSMREEGEYIYIYIYIYLVKVANLAVECSMPYKQNVV